MHGTTRMKITELNPHITCVLCQGYLVDATTIIECLHSFCRPCIVRYLESSKYCPICDVQVHRTKPLLNIRSDKKLQEIVYKIAPGVFKDEMRRRRGFYKEHPDEVKKLKNMEDRGEMDELSEHKIYTEDESISVCVQHCMKLPPYHNGSSSFVPSRKREDSADKRYLLCPAAFTVGMLKKFIRFKFELQTQFQIEVIHSDESLKDYYTLMDVVYIYGWSRMEPLKLYYLVFDRTQITLDLPGMQTESRVPFKKQLTFTDEPPDVSPTADSNSKQTDEVFEKSPFDFDEGSQEQSESSVDSKKDTGRLSPQEGENVMRLTSTKPRKDKASYNKSTKAHSNSFLRLKDKTKPGISNGDKVIDSPMVEDTTNGDTNRSPRANGNSDTLQRTNGGSATSHKPNSENIAADNIKADSNGIRARQDNCGISNTMQNLVNKTLCTDVANHLLTKNICDTTQPPIKYQVNNSLSADDQETYEEAKVYAHKALESLQSVDAASDSLEPLDSPLVINEDMQTTDNSSQESAQTVESNVASTSCERKSNVSNDNKKSTVSSSFKQLLSELNCSTDMFNSVTNGSAPADTNNESRATKDSRVSESAEITNKITSSSENVSSQSSAKLSNESPLQLSNQSSVQVSNESPLQPSNQSSVQLSNQSPLDALQKVSNFPLRNTTFGIPRHSYVQTNKNNTASRHLSSTRPPSVVKHPSPLLSNGVMPENRKGNQPNSSFTGLSKTVSGMCETVANSIKQMHTMTNGQLFPKPECGKDQSNLTSGVSRLHTVIGSGISPKTEPKAVVSETQPGHFTKATNGINNNKSDVFSKNAGKRLNSSHGLVRSSNAPQLSNGPIEQSNRPVGIQQPNQPQHSPSEASQRPNQSLQHLHQAPNQPPQGRNQVPHQHNQSPHNSRPALQQPNEALPQSNQASAHAQQLPKQEPLAFDQVPTHSKMQHNLNPTAHSSQSPQLPSPVIQHPNQVVYHPNQGVQHPNQVVYHPNQGVQHPNQVVQHHSQVGQHPSQVGQHPNQVGQHPNQVVQHPNQVGQHPNHVPQPSSNQNTHAQHPNKSTYFNPMSPLANQAQQQSNQMLQTPNQGFHASQQGPIPGRRFMGLPTQQVLCPVTPQTQEFLTMNQQKFESVVNQAIKTGTVKQVAINNIQGQAISTNQFLTQLTPTVLQNLNATQLENCLAGKIKRKRGRPPKDKNKILEQLRAQQSPAKHRRLLPKGLCIRPTASTNSIQGPTAQSMDTKPPFVAFNGAGPVQRPPFRNSAVQHNQCIPNGTQSMPNMKQEVPNSMNGIPIQQVAGALASSQTPGGMQGVPANLPGVPGAMYPGVFQPGAMYPGLVSTRPQFVQTLSGNVYQQQPVSFQNQQLFNMPRQFLPGHVISPQTMFSPVMTPQVLQQNQMTSQMSQQVMQNHSMTSPLNTANQNAQNGPSQNNSQYVTHNPIQQPAVNREVASTPENSSTAESESCDDEKPPILREPITIAPIEDNLA